MSTAQRVARIESENVLIPMPAPRSTSTRTVAATQARRQKRAQKLALDLAMRLTLLDDEWLCELAKVVLYEVDVRDYLASEARARARREVTP